MKQRCSEALKELKEHLLKVFWTLRGGNVPFGIPRGRAPGLTHILQGSESKSETGEQEEHSNDPEGRHLNFKAGEVPYSSKS